MLLSLHIENIAVIRSVDFDFSKGFMVLTGETGAGKSIVIDSINLLLGAKAERELIRTGAPFAMVSGLFGELTDAVKGKLAEIGVSTDDDGTILVQRTLSQDGRSKINLNGRSISLSLLKSITPLLVNIHGQSDTASLMEAKNHLELLDTFANANELKEEYRAAYLRLEDVKRRISELTASARESERMKEILEYQIRDIDGVSPRPGEEEELFEKKLKIKNSEKITKNSEFVYKALKGSEKGSVSFLLDRSATALAQIGDVVPDFAEYSERLKDILYQIDDVAEEVYAVLDDMDADGEETLNSIESRLDKLTKLKRKYGITLEAVLAFRDKAAEDLSALENSDELLKKLAAEETEAYDVALKLANKLHELRASVAKELEAKVKDTLEFLDMPKVVFFVSQNEAYSGDKKLLNRDGCDTVEFYISANRGADAQPLSKIASGGELSRIMLALKSVIADKDGIPTIIYDEIDAGVSGKTARKIGIKMLDLSRSAQLFCVTHSAQIASLADVHFLISKSDVNGATETSVSPLDRDGRVKELSRILGGIDITDAQRAAAEDMLSEKSEYTK
ncbi:MAG: DNA repair protein RecN [Clostridia bacterium]|nr:DNA repair protein RecN [Clostridia bacterium]